MHNKKAINKFLAIILMSILICSFLAVTTFAEETTEVRYATAEDVNLVFDKYLDNFYFTPLPESDTVTKSELYNTMLDTYDEDYPFIPHLKLKLPIRILLDLKNYPKDLITEDDLYMYLDEFEKSSDNPIRVKFVGDLPFWGSILLIMILLGGFCIPSTPNIPNYDYWLEKISVSLSSVTENISSIKETFKSRKR